MIFCNDKLGLESFNQFISHCIYSTMPNQMGKV